MKICRQVPDMYLSPTKIISAGNNKGDFNRPSAPKTALIKNRNKRCHLLVKLSLELLLLLLLCNYCQLSLLNDKQRHGDGSNRLLWLSELCLSRAPLLFLFQPLTFCLRNPKYKRQLPVLLDRS